MCHTSESMENRTETAHMVESDNPKMEQQDFRTKSEAGKCSPLEQLESLGGNQFFPCYLNYFRVYIYQGNVSNLIL